MHKRCAPLSKRSKVSALRAAYVPPPPYACAHRYTVNTLDWRSYERLLRRVLSYPKRPAVVLVNFFKQWMWPHRRGAPAQDERAAAATARAEAGLRPVALSGERLVRASPGDGEAAGGAADDGTPLSSFEYEGESRTATLAQWCVRCACAVCAAAGCVHAGALWSMNTKQPCRGRTRTHTPCPLWLVCCIAHAVASPRGVHRAWCIAHGASRVQCIAPSLRRSRLARARYAVHRFTQRGSCPSSTQPTDSHGVPTFCGLTASLLNIY